jgi:Ca2+-binding EF-hand superfamily protein
MNRLYFASLLAMAILSRPASAFCERLSPYAAPQISEKTDPADDTERLLLITPAGPLVVELAITIDGESFRMGRERLVDRMIADADRDGDGQATWAEALAMPRFGFGMLGYQKRTPEQIKSYADNYDTNKDGAIDRDEARRMLAQISGGGAFMIQGIYNYGWGGYAGGMGATSGQSSALLPVLDRDHDGSLSKAELTAAAERLKTRDVNGDDMLTLLELSSAPTMQYAIFSGRGYGYNGRQPRQTAVLLSPSTTDAMLYSALQSQQITVANCTLTPHTFAALDVDENGVLDQNEVAGFETCDPHLRLVFRLGETGDEPAGVSLDEASEEIKDRVKVVSTQGGSLHLALGAVALQIRASGSAPKPDYKSSAENLIKQWDKDKNMYLERDELPENQPGYQQQFNAWDADEDGKVYAKEIQATYELTQLPTQTRLAAMAGPVGNQLWSAVETSGDQRLSLREAQGAAENLMRLDSNGDGALQLGEIPQTISLTIGRGAVNAYNIAQVAPSQSTDDGAKPPAWHTRMDRNRDGDLTPREFLGAPAQFQKLDANGDGFICAKEAAGE